MRFFLEIAYKGTRYHGWQIQPNASSVQETIQKALKLIFRKPMSIMGAGRTDTGVHAKQMYAHFDFEKPFLTEQVLYKLNGILPKDIVIKAIHTVHDDAHARFDATHRTYHYFIATQKNPFYTDASWFVKHHLDVEAMNIAAQKLLTYTNFQCFSKTNTDVKTFNCTITEAYWEQKDDMLVFTITADRFLRNMVRAIVGTLVAIGSGKLPVEALDSIIMSRDRGQAGASAPAQGLFLTAVGYEYIG